MADDAGALLVRSGLVSASALEDARARVVSLGGTVGEQLVTCGAIADDELTQFYRARLLVPQVNPNTLARLTPRVVAAIPGDMAIELRAIPVSLDNDNNLTVALSDPSDRHAVDEIAFFTGAYVVRAVATQMQIAWCLAHYYGHVTALGQRLLRSQSAPLATSPAAASQGPRAKGLTGKVNASRHRTVAPVTGPLDMLRPTSSQLDLPPPGTPPGLSGTNGASRGSSAGHAGAADGTPIIPGLIRPNPSLTRSSSSSDGIAIAAVAGEAAEPAEAPRAALRSAGAPSSPGRSVSAAMAARGSAPGHSAPGASAAAVGHAASSAPDAAYLAASADPAGIAVARLAGLPGAAMAGLTGAPASSGPLPITGRPPGIDPGPPAGAPTASGPLPVTTGQPSGSLAASGPSLVATAATRSPPTRPSPVPDSAAAAAPSPTSPDRTTSNGASAAPRLAHPPDDLDDADHDTDSDADDDTDDEHPHPSEPGAVVSNGIPGKVRTRSISGEIRVPGRRAASIKPPLPHAEEEEDPLIMIEMRDDEEDAAPRPLPLRRRPIVKSDPPELYARAGEVALKAGSDRAIDANEPRIVIDQDALIPQGGTPGDARTRRTPVTAIDIVEDDGSGAVIHDRVVDRAPVSGPPSPGAPASARGEQDADPRQDEEEPTGEARGLDADDQDHDDDEEEDTGEVNVVELVAPKRARSGRSTQLGVMPPAGARTPREADAGAARGELRDLDRATHAVGDATSIDLRPAPPGEDTTSDQIAAPPAPASDADTNPYLVAPPPAPAPPLAPRAAAIPRAVIVEDEPSGPLTQEMSALELDDAIPGRASGVPSDQLLERRVDHDAVDDGWGPPGTTIPPPLLGAIPGSDDDDDPAGTIPMPNMDSSPLIVGAARPAPGDPSGRALARALEDATARAIEVIRQLERTHTRDEVVDVMIGHLAESHHRAGFLATRHSPSRGSSELGLFAMMPRPAVMPSATLRLDRSSTLQDVVGTRLPYRGPMHDDTSRTFLASILGAVPAEILLVPVTVRERVVGVLFGEHRLRHTFDDQLALAARAAGMALERILRTRAGQR